MKRLWTWMVARRRTLGWIGLAYLALELLVATAVMLGVTAYLH